jgi:VanZ family protein
MSAKPGRRRRIDVITAVLTVVALGVLLVPIHQDLGLQRLFNVAHIPGFALLAAFWAEDLLAREWSTRRRLWTVAIVGLLAAGATEALQALVPGRYADVADMLRNALGIALGLAVHARWPGFLATRLQRG